ncbi:carbohydrate kinase family protein [Streptomyces adustus]|uniref:Carbohydrate kinase family protein n=1 Tax=Streptomyces adustus TaxID=1609272 RepID=A0A5N8V735_9ACTN|nr:PfkB family carbohydrate kinase [Streptomyces adustus]MPY29785.1 carbohydrate kinase family protein [Streptomyces adustus]
MRVAVTGAIATDQVLTVAGRLTDGTAMGRGAAAVRAETLHVRRGGAGANIAVGLGRLALRPLLAGAVGKDFADYGRDLQSYGVDLELVHVSEELDTARAVEIRDTEDGRLRLSYDGAQPESRRITLLPAARRIGGLGLVVVAAGDIEAMVRHTEECRRLGIPFAADPGDRLSRLTGRQARRLVDGARYAFTDEFDVPLLRELTGWGDAELLNRVGTWVVTRGLRGVAVLRRGRPANRVEAVRAAQGGDPSGTAEAFRAGYLAGAVWGWSAERGAQLGCALAAAALESNDAQGYPLMRERLTARIRCTYGPEAADQIAARLPS